jgi:hypothetical protein
LYFSEKLYCGCIKKARDLVRREVLCNILIEFGIPVKCSGVLFSVDPMLGASCSGCICDAFQEVDCCTVPYIASAKDLLAHINRLLEQSDSRNWIQQK